VSTIYRRGTVYPGTPLSSGLAEEYGGLPLEAIEVTAWELDFGYQRIYGPAHLATSPTDLFTVPDDLLVRLRHIFANNPSGSPVDFTFSIGASYANEVLADAPVAYYRMGESSGLPQDSSGNAQHSTSVGAGLGYGGTGLITSDALNASMTFSGATTGWAKIPDSDILDITGELTIEAWVVATALTDASGYNTIVSKYPGAATGYELYVENDGRINLTIRGGGSSFEFTTAAGEIVVDTPYHIVGTYKDSTNAFVFYKNGVQVDSDTNAVSLATNTALLSIGGRSSNGVVDPVTLNWEGRIDEVAIYPTALSVDRVAAHYTAGVDVAPAINIYDSYNIPAGGSLEWAYDHALTAGEKIQAYAGSATTLVLTVDAYVEPM
jgi:hypothetical protein